MTNTIEDGSSLLDSKSADIIKAIDTQDPSEALHTIAGEPITESRTTTAENQATAPETELSIVKARWTQEIVSQIPAYTSGALSKPQFYDILQQAFMAGLEDEEIKQILRDHTVPFKDSDAPDSTIENEQDALETTLDFGPDGEVDYDVLGGEIVHYRRQKTLPGETSLQALQREWDTYANNAWKKENVDEETRRTNAKAIQEKGREVIRNAAISAIKTALATETIDHSTGKPRTLDDAERSQRLATAIKDATAVFSRDQLKTELQALGIPIAENNTEATQPPVEQPISEQQHLDGIRQFVSTNAVTAETNAQLQKLIDAAKAANVPVDSIKQVLSETTPPTPEQPLSEQQHLDGIRQFIAANAVTAETTGQLQELVNKAKEAGIPPEKIRVALERPKPAPPSPEQLARMSKEHVLYAPRIKIIPDTHGLSPDYYGVDENSADVVSIGDIIDAPKDLSLYNTRFDDSPSTKFRIQNMYERAAKDGWKKVAQVNSEAEFLAQIEKNRIEWNKKHEALQNVNIARNIEVWTHLLESGKGEVVLGNHELMAMSGLIGNNDSDLSQWLVDTNKGKTTLAAFGIDVSNINPIMDDNDKLTVMSHEQCELIRSQVSAIPELKKFFDLLVAKGKMYVIANEMLVVHAGVPIKEDGTLLEPQRHHATWPGFEGVTGLDAFEKIEEGIRAGDVNILHWLASGKTKQMSPGWVREPFFNVMSNEAAANKAVAELSAQAAKRGADIKGIMIGHTEAVGGKFVGNKVLGTDTAVGDLVELDATTKDKVAIKASHNFGQSGAIGYSLTNNIQ